MQNILNHIPRWPDFAHFFWWIDTKTPSKTTIFLKLKLFSDPLAFEYLVNLHDYGFWSITILTVSIVSGQRFWRCRFTNSKSLRSVHANLSTSKRLNIPGMLRSVSHSLSSSLIRSAGRLQMSRSSLLQMHQRRRGEHGLSHSQSTVLQYRHRAQHPNQETFSLRPVKNSWYRNNLI